MLESSILERFQSDKCFFPLTPYPLIPKLEEELDKNNSEQMTFLKKIKNSKLHWSYRKGLGIQIEGN